MNKLLLLGIIVVTIGLSASFLAFKFLPAEKDLATGAVVGGNGGQVNLAVVNPNETTTQPVAEPQAATNSYPDQIVEGMTMDKVTELAGEPVDKQTITSSKGNIVEYWYYQKDGTWQIAFSDSVVSAVRKY